MAYALMALALVGTGVAAAVLIPQITESKRERTERLAREAAAARAERLQKIRIEQRPRFGRAMAGGPAAIAEVGSAITLDANRRVRSGELQNAVERTTCRRGPRTGTLQPLACTAITSVIPEGPGSRGGVVGYPYRAQIDLATGKFALCKTSGQAGEGALDPRERVPLPRACGG